MPVVSDDGGLLGVVSEGDFLVKEQGAEAIRHRPLARIFGESRTSRASLAKFEALTAGQAMTAPALTIASDRHISEAAALMTARGVNRLPVVDDGRLVGIVTRADLVRAYVRSDDSSPQQFATTSCFGSCGSIPRSSRSPFATASRRSADGSSAGRLPKWSSEP